MIKREYEYIKDINEKPLRDPKLVYIETPITLFADKEFIYVDEWIPTKADIILKPTKDFIIIPLSKYFDLGNMKEEEVDIFDYFSTESKKCYNTDNKYRIIHYLNYLLKFYDQEYELLAIYMKLKYLIDYEELYTEELLLEDIKRYILYSDIFKKVRKMNDDNYIVSLQYKGSKSNESLQFTTAHGKYLMEVSLLIDIIIPICTHFVYVNNIDDVNQFLLNCYNIIFQYYETHEGFNIYSKIFETCFFNINRVANANSVLWAKQAIRGRTKTTHTLDSVNNIILNVVPRYMYVKNIVSFNYSTIKKMSSLQIYDIQYEFRFQPLSLSKRDEDNNSEFDRFESQLIKQDEAMFIQNQVNCEMTMQKITGLYGRFKEEEIQYFMDNVESIYSLQRDLIFNLFYKDFGDPIAVNALKSKKDYIILMLAGREKLIANGLILLPYILSSKVEKITKRNNINKKERLRISSSESYQSILKIYRNDEIIDNILAFIATILSSEFRVLDYYDKELDGKVLKLDPDILLDEMQIYISLINN